MNILIVDDEPAIADTLSYALRAEGFATECCTLGSEAQVTCIEEIRDES